jgi:hypothetical protein
MEDRPLIMIPMSQMKKMISILEDAYVFDDDKAAVLQVLKQHLPYNPDPADESLSKERFIAP